ncbi:uncharacterized protein LOC109812276 [Cajanus cajan]|uniref:Uncharacterized protein n=1 Tax=Cajanus cajan TaxID=3821 RepID=A0A151S852_CAJCA|nr:uncharacterized protein LOC109812276 [Cajanus cajan]KYP50972.1 hypothetical protein KK1_027182 [Cajanus cajan]
MEGISWGLKKYWMRRVKGYQRLIYGSDRRRREATKLGSRRRRRRRTWHIKIAPKMRIPKISSPKKMVLWLRDAYVRIMLGLASSTAASAVGYGGGFGRAPPAKEYDEEMMVHMYNSLLMAHGHLLPPPNAAATIVNTS